jgi:hypothetical protein
MLLLHQSYPPSFPIQIYTLHHQRKASNHLHIISLAPQPPEWPPNYAYIVSIYALYRTSLSDLVRRENNVGFVEILGYDPVILSLTPNRAQIEHHRH